MRWSYWLDSACSGLLAQFQTPFPYGFVSMLEAALAMWVSERCICTAKALPMKGVALSTMQLEDHLQTLMVLWHHLLWNMRLMFVNEAAVISSKHICCVCFRPWSFILQVSSKRGSPYEDLHAFFNWLLKTVSCFAISKTIGELWNSLVGRSVFKIISYFNLAYQ